jgi:hypothetical protein
MFQIGDRRLLIADFGNLMREVDALGEEGKIR